MQGMQSEDVIAALGLIQHPEGGYFRETYRSGCTPMTSRGATDITGHLLCTDALTGIGMEGRFGGNSTRNILTSIYYMLTRDRPRLWINKNKSDIVHYWHGGSAIRYDLLHPSGKAETIYLGPRLTEGQVLQLVVPGGTYKAAEYVEEESIDFSLIGEAVAPGFDYRDLSFVSMEELQTRHGVMKDGDFERFQSFVKQEGGKEFQEFYD